MSIISLGYKCETAKFLRDNELRNVSCPFDWAITMSLSTINSIILDSDFTEKYLKNVKDIGIDKQYIKYFGAGAYRDNLLYISENYKGLIFRHFDFLNIDKHYQTEERRIIRFKNRLLQNDPILFIRELHNGNVNERLKKANITTYELNDNNLDILKNNIDNFFYILKTMYNRTDDIILIITDKKKLNKLRQHIVCKNTYFSNNITSNLIKQIRNKHFKT